VVTLQIASEVNYYKTMILNSERYGI